MPQEKELKILDKQMMSKGYHYWIRISNVSLPLYLKSSAHAGPLMREGYPQERILEVRDLDKLYS